MLIELKVGNKRYRGWEKVQIKKSMQSIAHSLSMDIFQGDQIQIGDDEIIQVLKDGKVFFTGYLESQTLGISDVKKPLSITAKSKAMDLIECNIQENKQYNKQDVEQIISDLIKPFNISVSVPVSKYSFLFLLPLEVFDTKVGETYFNAINRLCKQTNTLPISNEFGNIEIINNQQVKSGEPLKDGYFKELNFPRNLSKRFSEYTYKKEGAETDVTDGTIDDSTVKRFRPFVGVNTEDKDNVDLAKWQKNHNKVDELKLTAKVVGWDLEINTIRKLETSIVNSDFLVHDIVFTKDDSGTTSNVSFVSKDLYV